VAIDSGVAVVGRRGGQVDSVDASRIVVRVNDNETLAGEPGVDIYNLTKHELAGKAVVILENRAVRAAKRAEIGRTRGFLPNLGVLDSAGFQQRRPAGLAGIVDVDREAYISAERVEGDEIVVRRFSLLPRVRSRFRNALLG